MVANPIPYSGKRRSHFLLIAEILVLARDGALKTPIMYGAGMSYSQINEYLSFLLGRNLIETSNSSEKTKYKTTEKGLQFLQHYREIKQLLNAEEQNHTLDANSLNLIKFGPRVIIAR